MSLANNPNYVTIAQAAEYFRLPGDRFRAAARSLGLEIIRELDGITAREFLSFAEAEKLAHYIQTGELLPATAAPADEQKAGK